MSSLAQSEIEGCPLSERPFGPSLSAVVRCSDPNNAFDANARVSGALNKNDRLVFAARPDAFIDVFDTYWYSRVATVPIRDTIVGPVRVASIGGTLYLVGVTSRGLVVVQLPNFTNPLPVRKQPGVTVQPARVQVSTPQRSGARP